MPLSPHMTVAQRIQTVEDALERLFSRRHGFDIEPDGDGLTLYVVDPNRPYEARTGVSLFALARELEAML